MAAAQQDTGTSNPTVLRILIGAQLRQLREAAGLTCEQAGAHVRMRDASISRMENGKVPFDRRKARENVADLLTLYGVTDEQARGKFWELIAESGKPGWWEPFSDVLPSWFQTYVGLEAAAEQLRVFEAQLVHGLLQTEDYMRAVLATGAGLTEEMERRVKLRLARQRFLNGEGGPHAPKLWALLDEGAVRRVVGSRAIMRAQLDHLLWVASLPNVTVQVLPFEATGARVVEGGGFTILRFAGHGMPDIAYTEQLTGASYLEKHREVEQYAWAFDRLAAVSTKPAATTALLRRIRQEVAEDA